MQAASQKMYAQAGAGQPGADAGQQQQQQTNNAQDDIQDADFEEVK
jgi:molecular chaperone DnaK